MAARSREDDLLIASLRQELELERTRKSRRIVITRAPDGSSRVEASERELVDRRVDSSTVANLKAQEKSAAAGASSAVQTTTVTKLVKADLPRFKIEAGVGTNVATLLSRPEAKFEGAVGYRFAGPAWLSASLNTDADVFVKLGFQF